MVNSLSVVSDKAQEISNALLDVDVDYVLAVKDTEANYKMGDIFYTSAVYAFKAECDMPSVASIIGYGKTLEMFRNPEKFDLYERKKNRSVNDYFDELYFGKQEEQ